jgi:zinc protease
MAPPRSLGFRAALAALVVALAAGGTRAEPGKTFGAETFTLENGMQVVVIANHRAPVVHHSVWYKVGAADEPPGRSGIAHMLEHMMFKGTETIAAGEFSRIVARNGGRDNAFTSHDYTGYFQSISADRLELVMEMEADRMVNLVFDENDFLTEREVVLEERRSRTDTRASALFAEQLAAVQYLAHPYGTPIIGWEHEIRAFAYADALAFYSSHYAPNNAVLIVAGDITVPELRSLAERTYGAIPARPVPERARPTEPPQLAARRIEMKDPRVASPEWVRSYLAPSYRDDPDGLAVPTDVLVSILGGGTTTRLYQALVVDKELATDAVAYYQGGTYDKTRVTLFVRPRPGVAIEAVEAAVEAELATLIENGVEPDELDRAKFNIHAQAVYARDSLYSLARIFGTALTAGMTVEEVESWPDRVQAVTAEDVLAAAKALLVPEHSATGVLLPDGEEAS